MLTISRPTIPPAPLIRRWISDLSAELKTARKLLALAKALEENQPRAALSEPSVEAKERTNAG